MRNDDDIASNELDILPVVHPRERVSLEQEMIKHDVARADSKARSDVGRRGFVETPWRGHFGVKEQRATKLYQFQNFRKNVHLLFAAGKGCLSKEYGTRGQVSRPLLPYITPI